MVLALDNHGKVYFSLMQVNSNNFTMRLFLQEFCKILEKEDRHWRTNTMIFWDNASYHNAKETR
jgi:hypothetical protein